MVGEPWTMLGDIPRLQLLLFFLAVLTFTIGNNLISMFHCRRVGRKWRFFGNPANELVNYNLKEWIGFAVILATTVFFFFSAVRLDGQG